MHAAYLRQIQITNRNTVEPGYNTTSVYTTNRFQCHIFCSSSQFLAVKHNIILLGYNNTRLYRHKIFSPFHDVITEYNCI